MNNIELHLPWLLIICISILAIFGLIVLLYRFVEMIRFLNLLMRGVKPLSDEERQSRIEKILCEEDREAQRLIEQKTSEVWRSFSATNWLDFNAVRMECIQFVREIARMYHRDSPHPELEVTIFDLLKLNERISREITILLSPYRTLNRISVSSLLEAKSMIDHTRRIVGHKGVRAGRTIATRIWQTVNIINPKYWINRVIFKGASEMVGRKVLTSLYRIVGNEAIKIYRSSSALHIAPEDLIGKEGIEEEKMEPFSDGTSAKKGSVIESDKVEIMEEAERIEPPETKDETVQPEKEIKTGIKQKIAAKIAQTLNAFVEGSLQVWDKMASREKVLESYKKRGFDVPDLHGIRKLPIETVDQVADHYIRKGEWTCAAEGAATGAGGFLLLAADAPSLLALQLRTIQQIGYSYGFDVTRPEEKIFAVKLLSEAYLHPAKQERASLIKDMRMAADLVKGGGPMGLLSQRLFIQGFAKIAEKIGIRMGGRKVAQFIPLIGAVAGGVINKKITGDIARIAQEVYRDRLQHIQEADK
jgi:uncharacterized protein (DUF697 family)